MLDTFLKGSAKALSKAILGLIYFELTYMVIFFLLILARWISRPILQFSDVRMTNGTPYIVIRYIQLM